MIHQRMMTSKVNALRESEAREFDERENMGSLLVLVCTYNERENLPILIPKIAETVPQADILIVDDGSPDGTAKWVEQEQRHRSNLRLIERTGKLGLGSAIQVGMRYAIEHGYSWMLNLDGDMSHDPSVIPSMLKLVPQVDLVIGSRYVAGGGLQGCSWRRVFVSKMANRLARWIVGWKIGDCSSAYRLYRVASLKQIDLSQMQERGYGFLEEILAHFLRIGAKVQEVPIVYHERRMGKSKISLQEARSAFSALLRASRLRRSIRD